MARLPLNRDYWSPWSELRRLEHEMDRLFGGSRRAPGAGAFPPANVWANSDQAVLTTELPGIDPDKLDITVKDDTVTIRGNRDPEQTGEEQSYVRRERETGAFGRTFSLPFKVDADKVSAEYRRGVLELALPRSAEDKPKKITVSTE